MKFLLLFLSLIPSSCSYYHIAPQANTNICDQNMGLCKSEQACALIQRVQSYDYENWKVNIQKIRDTYARVLQVLDDKETIQFTVALFKALSLNEDLDRQTFGLRDSNYLPNIDSLKFFYFAEKKLDEMIKIITRFTNSSNQKIQYCALETEKYFRFHKDLVIAVRDVDFRKLTTKDIPQGIPPEVLKANAKLLEQRDQMSQSLISFYADLAEK